jgi:hypothetical protein
MPKTIEKTVPSATIAIVFFSGGQSSWVTGCSERSDLPMFPWARSWR